MNFDAIAYKEYRNQLIFQSLSERESDENFRDILIQLAEMERGHVAFWRKLAKRKEYHVNPLVLWIYMACRKLLGLTFVIRLLEMQEGVLVEQIREWLFHTNHPAKKDIETVLLVEEQQELKLIKQINEERVEFMGSIVLGLNDGIIELSGALTGFSFAFRHNPTVVLAGLILGISASLSMGSSAYLQAVHEKGKQPSKAALYVGGSYFLVLALLIWPFALLQSQLLPVALMVLSILIIVTGLSFYTAVVFARSFSRSLRLMLLFSIGTAVITFLIGTATRTIFGINI